MLAMFIGVVTPPLIVGRAIGLDVAETAFLVSISLFTSGVNTYIQVHRFGPFGSGLLSVQGTSFIFVGLAIETGKAGGLPLVFTLALVGAFVPMIVSRFIGPAQRVFPPVVTGSVVMLIGIGLIKVGFAAFAGGVGAPDFGSPTNLLLGLFTMSSIVLFHAFGRGFVSTVAIALGLALGYLVSALMGRLDLTAVANATWVNVPVPFRYPFRFDGVWLVPWFMAYMVVAIECIGNLTATSAVSGEPVSGPLYVERVKGGVLADGLGCAITSVFGALPKTSFSQNISIVALTRVASRRVGMIVGLMLVALGLFPKMAAFVSIMPQPVLGGGTVIMFAMVAVAGFDILQDGGFTPRKQLILAITLALGLGVTMVPEATAHLRDAGASTGTAHSVMQALGILMESGLSVGTMAAVILNLVLPPDSPDDAPSPEPGRSRG